MGVGGKECKADEDCKGDWIGKQNGTEYVCGSVKVDGLGSSDNCVDKKSCGTSAGPVSISCGPPIALIVILIIVVILIGVCVYCCCCKKKAQP